MPERVKVPAKVKSFLQKEINSECPFCSNQEVPYFEIHHIDGDRSNSRDENNLIMLCRHCHGKVESGAILHSDVVAKKAALGSRSWKVEFVSVTASESESGWSSLQDNEFAFFKTSDYGSPYPILNLTFINHLSQTVVMKEIEAEAMWRPRGISGIDRTPRQPKVLTPVTKYGIELSSERKAWRLTSPLEVPANNAFLFQLELYPADKAVAVSLMFNFSNSISVAIPTVFLNSESEDEFKMRISIAS